MNYSSTVKLPECYRILNIAPGSAWVEVKRAYHLLAKEHHPDRNPGNPASEDRFKNIAHAFQILEKHYRLIQEEDPPGRSPYQGENFEKEATDSETREAEPFADYLRRQFMDPGFEKGLSNLSGKIFKTLQECERKLFLLDVDMEVPIDPHIAERGGAIRVKRARENFVVQVPPRSYEGMTIRVPGRGDSGLLNPDRGDLNVRIHITRNQSAQDVEADRYYRVDLTREEIEQRRVFTLKMFEGPIKYSLPTTTRDGQSSVLKASADPFKGTRHIIVVHLV